MGKHPTAGASRQTALGSDELRRVDAWRASNYLSIGVIYLLGNPPPIHLCHPGGRASWDQRTAAMVEKATATSRIEWTFAGAEPTSELHRQPEREPVARVRRISKGRNSESHR
jgi:hypothetical protein